VKISARIKNMKKLMIITLPLILFACAPVLDRQLLEESERNPSFDKLRANPEVYKGKSFTLGGVIVDAKLVQDGSQLELLALSVDSKGYPEEGARGRAKGRYYAFYPSQNGLLDPMVYKKGRLVTLVGKMLGTRPGKIDEMEYIFPVFEIRQIHLWDNEDYPYYPYRYPYSYYYPYADPLWYYPYWRPGPWPPPPGWW
jgi:outer membrane lipoprotein